MIEVSVVKQKLQDYIVNQIDILGESNPAIKLVKPLAKRAIINNIDSFDKFINTIAKDGKGERHRYDENRGYDGSHGYDEEERMLLMQMLGVDGNERYNDYGDEHFNKQEAKRTVDEMYHVKDGKKYIGEKYDMQKAHEVCSKFKDKLEDEVEVADVYVAINAQYHDYCELFEKWFGKGNFDDMIFESAISFWFDDIDFGEDKLWKYFNELK